MKYEALPALSSSRAVQAIYFNRTRDASFHYTEKCRVIVTQRLKYEKFGNADIRPNE
jgi:hypothetical protein